MKRTFTLAITLLLSPCLWADSFQSVEQIKKLAYSYAKSRTQDIKHASVRIKVGDLDSRLQLASCPLDKLHAFSPYSRPIERTTTLGIRCDAKTRWKVYIPLSIKLVTPVIVAKHFIARGKVLHAKDLRTVEMDINRLKRGYFKTAQPIIGHISKRNIIAGRIITPSGLKIAKLIHRGERVHIIASHPSISVRMKGVALNSGSLGEIIRVKNVSSRKNLEATVVGPRQVQVNL